MKYSSTNKPLECILTESRCYNRSSKMKVKGVLWHSTAAPNTTIRRYVQPSKSDPKYDELMDLIGKNTYNNDWNDPNLKVCVHAFIGTLKDGTITSVQTLPWDLACYGCGSGSRGSCNDGWIQFEICEDSLTSKSYFDDIYKEACELTAYLCKLYDLDPMVTTTYNGYEIPVVLCHKDANTYKMGSNHDDVMHWFKKYGKTMNDVRKDVAKLMNQNVIPSNPTQPSINPVKPIVFKKGDIVKMVNDAVYYNNKIIPSWIKDLEWVVTSVNGDRVVIDKSVNGKYSIMSPINASNLILISREQEDVSVSIDTSKINVSPIDEKKMWNYFLKSGMTEYGVAGLMGNLYAESLLRPTNLQDSFEKKLNMSDAEYTAAVDTGIYTDFINDSAGYGLAQWTYHTLKRDMLAYHQKKGKSIGDGDTQMEFLVYQLSTEYPAIWQILTTAKTVREASDAILLKFERPADQSETMQKKRADFGQKYYDKFYTETSVITKKIERGAVVKIALNAVYMNGKTIPNWVKNLEWIVESVEENRVIINNSKDGKYSIMSAVDIKYLSLVDAPAQLQPETQKPVIEEFKPYVITVTASLLNYRSGPGPSYSIKGQIKKGDAYTIIEEKDGWGKLKSGAGWIALEYTKKI